MTKSSKKVQRYARYIDSSLYLRVDSKVTLLGTITTRHGGLTREQKLKAVAADGEWVEI